EEGAEEGAGEEVGEIADEGAGETAGGSTHEGSQLLGVVDHLLETGANDVLVLRPCPGSIDDRERLLPYLPGRVVSKVDRCRGRIDVRWHPDD
ncbi:MAG: hypothetical protein V2I82_17165, partial [Halieaceae bacterium]|nr:hypothetical protein [Halieaceae bacterium]